MKSIIFFTLIFFSLNVNSQEIIKNPSRIHLSLQSNGLGIKAHGYFVKSNIVAGAGYTSYQVNTRSEKYRDRPFERGQSYFIESGLDIYVSEKISLNLLGGVNYTQYVHYELENTKAAHTLNFVVLAVPVKEKHTYSEHHTNFIGAFMNCTISYEILKNFSLQSGLNLEINQFKNPMRFVLGVKVQIATEGKKL
jgi:hypothetical protein